MALRYSGDLTVEVDFNRHTGSYRAVVREGDRVLWFGNVRAIDRRQPVTGETPAAYDAAARSALSHAEEYSPEVASRSEEDEDGRYKVRRSSSRTRSRDRHRRDSPSKRPRFVPVDARSWDPRDVLAGAYRGRKFEGEETFLVHAVWMDALDTDGDAIGKKTICRRIDIDNLVGPGESYRHRVTCPICRERVERSGLPETLLAPERDRRRARPSHARRRDPAKPGEFERHARAPVQRVFVFAKDGDIIVVFPGVQNRRGATMVYRESGPTYEHDALGHYVRDRSWERVGPDHRDASEANRLLHHLIDDHGWRIAAQPPGRDARYRRRTS